MEGGAYLLHLECLTEVRLDLGALGSRDLPAGLYVYIGSARGGIEKRVERHRRLAREKAGKIHWHIDRLLIHPAVRLICVEPLPGKKECSISRKMARRPFVSVPVPGFGASDCRAGCLAHLLQIDLKQKDH